MHEAPAPSKIRVVGLQDIHLDPVLEIEQLCKAQHHHHGVSEEALPVRSLRDIAQLPRKHNVRVAEADDRIAGYGAWRDEEPGIGYVEELAVHPDYQEHAVGAAILDKIREEARAAGIKYLAVRAWASSPTSKDYFLAQHFLPVPADAPDEVKTWKELQSAAGPLLADGQVLLYALVG
ncbi:MAG: GNAT family N-acetyltransferase [Polyangiaceae bacterium]